MSYSVTIMFGGHHNGDKNADVAKAVDAAVEALSQARGGSGSVTGYSWANGEERLDFARMFNSHVDGYPLGGTPNPNPEVTE